MSLQHKDLDRIVCLLVETFFNPALDRGMPESALIGLAAPEGSTSWGTFAHAGY